MNDMNKNHGQGRCRFMHGRQRQECGGHERNHASEHAQEPKGQCCHGKKQSVESPAIEE